MRIHVAWAVLTAVLLGLCLLQRETISLLLQTNARLIEQVVLMRATPHPVHDAQLTVFTEPDGNLLIVVNGEFPHRVYSPCSSRPF